MDIKIERAFPAFPYPPEQTRLTLQLGMSLRDYFAAAALQSFLSHEWMTETAKQFENPAAQIAEFRAFIASKSYSYADAMLAERDKP